MIQEFTQRHPGIETWTTRNRVGWWIFFSQGVSSFREDVHLWGRVTLKYFHIWKRKSTFFLKNVKIQMLASYLYKFKLRLQRRSLITGIFYSTNHHSPFGDSVFQVTRLSLPILSPSTHHQLDHQSCEVFTIPCDDWKTWVEGTGSCCVLGNMWLIQ